MRATHVLLLGIVALVAVPALILFGTGAFVVHQWTRPEVQQTAGDVADTYRVMAAAARCCPSTMQPMLEKYGERFGDKWKEVTRKETEELRQVLISRGIEVPKTGGLVEAYKDLTTALILMATKMERTPTNFKRSMRQPDAAFEEAMDNMRRPTRR